MIFLDIDGVICCNWQCELEETKLAHLRRICKATGAKVVLSSDWRRQAPLKQRVRRALQSKGVDYIGCTPQRSIIETVGRFLVEKPCRPLEISLWLAQYRPGHTPPPWVAIDDRDLLTEVGGSEMEGHFVQTAFSTGLTSKLAEQIISLLKGEDGEPLATGRAAAPSVATSASAVRQVAVT